MSDLLTYEQRIPKNIFQTWASKNVPLPMKEAMKTLQDLNPEYQWIFYDNDDCRKLITENFNPFVLMAYDSLVPSAFKADLWRLCALYMYGGVYADCKQVHLLPLREYVKPDCDFFICNDIPRTRSGLYNALIGSIPKSEILAHLINKIVWNVANHWYGEHDLMISGPLHYKTLINSLLERDGSTIFKLARYQVIGYNVDVILQLIDIAPIYTVDESGRKAFMRAYSSYYGSKHSTMGNDPYWIMWRNRKIYANPQFQDEGNSSAVNNLQIKFYPSMYNQIIKTSLTMINEFQVKINLIGMNMFIPTKLKLICQHKDEVITIDQPKDEEVITFQKELGK